MDGISVDITYINGMLVRATTRGDGSVGQDVTQHVKAIPSIPNKISYTKRVITSGELICSKHMFKTRFSKKNGGKYAAARNFVGGLLNAKLNAEVKQQLRFVSYIAFGISDLKENKDWLNKQHEMLLLKAAKFETVADHGAEQIKSKGKTSKWFEAYFKAGIKANRSSPFEQDGLVVEAFSVADKRKLGELQAYYPAWAKAIKLDVEDQVTKSAIIASVEADMSIRRRYAPVAWFKNSIDFNGATVEKATAFNYKFVKDNGIGVGAKVQLVRSGDVIPRIKACTTPATVSIPKNCKWCRAKLQWTKTKTDLYCSNEACVGLPYLRMHHFVSCLDIDGVSSGIVDLVWGKKGLSTQQLLTLKREKLYKVDGIGPAKAKQLVDGLKTSLNGIEEAELMYASGFFCDENTGLGTTRLQDILSSLKAKGFKDLDQVAIQPIKASAALMKTHGLGAVIVKLFMQKLPLYLAWYRSIQGLIKLKKVQTVTGPLSGMGFAFTGFRDKSLEQTITSNGGTIEGVKTTTSVLFYAKESGKTAQADKYGIKRLPQAKCVAYVNSLLKRKPGKTLSAI